MKISLSFLSALCLIFLLHSCYYDVEEELYGGGVNCTVTSATYSADVQPIIKSSCLPCHSNAAAPTLGANISLEGHADLKKKADDGSLLCAVKQLGCASPMPKGGGKLPSCSLAKIDKWIADGSQNN